MDLVRNSSGGGGGKGMEYSLGGPGYSSRVEAAVDAFMDRLGGRLGELEVELRYAWRAVDLLSHEYVKMWEKLERLEILLYEQQSVITQLMALVREEGGGAAEGGAVFTANDYRRYREGGGSPCVSQSDLEELDRLSARLKREACATLAEMRGSRMEDPLLRCTPDSGSDVVSWPEDILASLSALGISPPQQTQQQHLDPSFGQQPGHALTPVTEISPEYATSDVAPPSEEELKMDCPPPEGEKRRTKELPKIPYQPCRLKKSDLLPSETRISHKTYPPPGRKGGRKLPQPYIDAQGRITYDKSLGVMPATTAHALSQGTKLLSALKDSTAFMAPVTTEGVTFGKVVDITELSPEQNETAAAACDDSYYNQQDSTTAFSESYSYYQDSSGATEPSYKSNPPQQDGYDEWGGTDPSWSEQPAVSDTEHKYDEHSSLPQAYSSTSAVSSTTYDMDLGAYRYEETQSTLEHPPQYQDYAMDQPVVGETYQDAQGYSGTDQYEPYKQQEVVDNTYDYKNETIAPSTYDYQDPSQEQQSNSNKTFYDGSDPPVPQTAVPPEKPPREHFTSSPQHKGYTPQKSRSSRQRRQRQYSDPVTSANAIQQVAAAATVATTLQSSKHLSTSATTVAQDEPVAAGGGGILSVLSSKVSKGYMMISMPSLTKKDTVAVASSGGGSKSGSVSSLFNSTLDTFKIGGSRGGGSTKSRSNSEGGTATTIAAEDTVKDSFEVQSSLDDDPEVFYAGEQQYYQENTSTEGQDGSYVDSYQDSPYKNPSDDYTDQGSSYDAYQDGSSYQNQGYPPQDASYEDGSYVDKGTYQDAEYPNSEDYGSYGKGYQDGAYEGDYYKDASDTHQDASYKDDSYPDSSQAYKDNSSYEGYADKDTPHAYKDTYVDSAYSYNKDYADASPYVNEGSYEPDASSYEQDHQKGYAKDSSSYKQEQGYAKDGSSYKQEQGYVKDDSQDYSKESSSNHHPQEPSQDEFHGHDAHEDVDEVEEEVEEEEDYYEASQEYDIEEAESSPGEEEKKEVVVPPSGRKKSIAAEEFASLFQTVSKARHNLTSHLKPQVPPEDAQQLDHHQTKKEEAEEEEQQEKQPTTTTTTTDDDRRGSLESRDARGDQTNKKGKKVQFSERSSPDEKKEDGGEDEGGGTNLDECSEKTKKAVASTKSKWMKLAQQELPPPQFQ